MEITQAPTGWEDKSEHEGSELDYKFFKAGNGQRSVLIHKHEWDGAQEWTAMARSSNMIVDCKRLGKFENLSDAVKIAEDWLGN